MRNNNDRLLLRGCFGLEQILHAAEAALAASSDQGYPPFNIEKIGDNGFVIQMAVAGFTPADLEITTEDGKLTVVGNIPKAEEAPERIFTHRGISSRPFRQVWALTDYVEVTGSTLENGLLSIHLQRNIPEAARRRTIDVRSAA